MNKKKYLLTGGSIVFVLAIVLIGKYSVLESFKNRYPASPSGNDIICNTYDEITYQQDLRFRRDIIEGKIPQQHKDNPINVLCHWIGDDNKERILYEMELDNKASQTFMLIIEPEENIIKEIVPETAAFI